MERNWWTVALVGRFSSGKSSLLNYLLGTHCLPSGGTPVTAVPIRIVPGAEVLVVLSNADLLAPADRDKAVAYLKRQFATALGRDVPVAPVSVMSGHESFAVERFDSAISPRAARHRELAAIALRRKSGALREAFVATLARHAGRGPARVADPEQTAVVAGARAMLEGGRRHLLDLAFERTPRADASLGEVAAIVAENNHAKVESLESRAVHALNGIAAQVAEAFATLLRDSRAGAAQALDGTVAGVGDPGPTSARPVRTSPITEPLPAPSSRPLFDPTSVLAANELSVEMGRSQRARLAVERSPASRSFSRKRQGLISAVIEVTIGSISSKTARYLCNFRDSGLGACGLELRLINAFNTRGFLKVGVDPPRSREKFLQNSAFSESFARPASAMQASTS